jgi:hypothetical protein
MNAIRVRHHLTSRVLDLPELEPLVGKNVEIIVIEESEAQKANAAPSGPKAGSAKGQVKMAADFDAPLEDFADYT